MDEPMVSVSGFVKSYGGVPAVKGISFEVRRGEIFALLGPNGAGKTSTLESLEGLRRPDGGELRVAGLDPARSPRRLAAAIGVQLQTSALPPAMTVDEAMKFFSAYHRVRPRADLLERLGITATRRTQYGQLSVGQQRRLTLAVAMAHDPAVLFLDEPTAGLDVQTRAELHAIVRELLGKGTTVLLATHDMAEAEKLADRAAILLKGTIAALGTPRQLTATGSRRTRVSVATENGRLLERDVAFPAAELSSHAEGYAVYHTADTGRTVAAILAWLEAEADPLIDLRVERPSLEERFLEITSGTGARA